MECNDGSYYTGVAKDINKRQDLHNSGKGAKYTNSRKPVSLVYLEKYPSKSEAMKREYAVKQLTRNEKEKLVHTFSSFCSTLSTLMLQTYRW
jgi:putative endonuclease